jgi:hypothetical protein
VWRMGRHVRRRCVEVQVTMVDGEELGLVALDIRLDEC